MEGARGTKPYTKRIQSRETKTGQLHRTVRDGPLSGPIGATNHTLRRQPPWCTWLHATQLLGCCLRDEMMVGWIRTGRVRPSITGWHFLSRRSPPAGWFDPFRVPPAPDPSTVSLHRIA